MYLHSLLYKWLPKSCLSEVLIKWVPFLSMIHPIDRQFSIPFKQQVSVRINVTVRREN